MVVWPWAPTKQIPTFKGLFIKGMSLSATLKMSTSSLMLFQGIDLGDFANFSLIPLVGLDIF
jgi:hypothetical protein